MTSYYHAIFDGKQDDEISRMMQEIGNKWEEKGKSNEQVADAMAMAFKQIMEEKLGKEFEVTVDLIRNYHINSIPGKEKEKWDK